MSDAHRAIFLDRDGTLIRNIPDRRELVGPEDFFPGVLATLPRLEEAGFLLFIVTNQGAVARKALTMEDVRQVNQSLSACVSRAGATITDIAVCPHHPAVAGRCDCRKPSPQMVFRLAHRHAVDLNASWMVGDNVSDVESGLAAGCQSALVLTGQGDAYVDTVHQRYRDSVVVTPSLPSLLTIIEKGLAAR